MAMMVRQRSNRHFALIAATALTLPAALAIALPAVAQEAPTAPIDATLYPSAVKVARTATGYRYVDPHGMTLYMLDPREARSRAGTVMGYCIGECAERFAPLPAAADAAPAGHWKPNKGPRGVQWTYLGSPVFTAPGDRKPGDTTGDGYADIAHPIDYIPARPAYLAPPMATARYIAGRWYLTDPDGKVLFTRRKADCSDHCAEMRPLLAGMASRPLGDWAAAPLGDRMQWTWKRKPVFIAAEPETLPTDRGDRAIAIGKD